VEHTVARRDIVERLQRLIDDAVSPLVSDAPFALLDFPDHSNVGDSAIWLGQIEFFRSRFGRRPSYVSRQLDFSAQALDAAAPDGTVFICGGGNFGDIWKHNQAFREMVLATLKHRRIVQLPQSLHYSSVEKRDETARAIAAHPNFTLLVRDRPSLEMATQHFDCRTELVPDMAFFMGLLPSGPPSFDVLALLRTDSERTGLDRSALGSIRVEDWLDESRAAVRLAKALGCLGAASELRLAGLKEAKLTAGARHRVNRGLAQLSSARAIVTDRLHCHILSLLLGRPHAVLDNSYGKIARFVLAFTEGSDLVHRAETLPAAVEWAMQRAKSGVTLDRAA
jgi:exopolysaccharide biosynthesis predicted pyruvyltransferase EpsI